MVLTLKCARFPVGLVDYHVITVIVISTFIFDVRLAEDESQQCGQHQHLSHHAKLINANTRPAI